MSFNKRFVDKHTLATHFNEDWNTFLTYINKSDALFFRDEISEKIVAVLRDMNMCDTVKQIKIKHLLKETT